MKSRRNSNSFMYETMRNQKWSMLIVSILMFIQYPITLIISLDNMERNGVYTVEEIIESVTNFLVYRDTSVWVGFKDTGYILLYSTLLLGIVAGIMAYSYLHNSSQVGLYHSLPISRLKLSSIKFRTATISFLIPLIFGNALFVIVALVRGYFQPDLLISMMVFFFYNVVIFWMGYFVSSIAMLLTGKLFIGVCGTAVFCGYIPLVVVLVNVLVETFFDTAYISYNFSESLMNKLVYVSPFTYINSIKWNSYTYVIGSLFIVAILWAIQQYLMKRRPSEVAGRSMAYKLVADVVKVLLVIIIAIGTGIFFYYIAYNANIWLYFGIIFGGTVAYLIIQLLYGVVFREIFDQKLQYVLTLVGAFLIMLIFTKDVFGYDSYIPKYDSIENINITFDVDNDYYQNLLFAEWYDVNMGKSEETYELVGKMIENSEEVNENETSWSELMQIQVVYELNNGSSVVREYTCYIEDMKEDLKSLWDNEEFLDSMYPARILGQDHMDWEITSMYISTAYNQVLEQEITSYKSDWAIESGELLTDEERQEFIDRLIEAYIEDCENITDGSILDEMPIIEGTVYATIYHSESQGGYWYSFDLLVYPSFTNTITVLEELGYEVLTHYEAEDVAYIEVYNYTDSEDELYPSTGEIVEDQIVYNETQEITIDTPTGESVLTIIDNGQTIYSDKEDLEAWLPLIYDTNFVNIFTEEEESRIIYIYLFEEYYDSEWDFYFAEGRVLK